MTSQPHFLQTQDFPPLSNFRCKAEVDWLDIAITTKNATNFNTIQIALKQILGAHRKTWVEPMDKGPGGAAHIFKIRLHDPKSHASLSELFADLEERFPLASLPSIAAMEVAVDFYSKSNNRSELEAMTMRLLRETANNGVNPRQFLTKTNTGASVMRELLNAEQNEYVNSRNTYYAGTKDVDPVEWRIYLKVTDQNQEPILDVSQFRARMETILLEHKLSKHFTTLLSLEGFRFECFAKLFSCRIFVPPVVNVGLLPMKRLLAERKLKILTDASRVGQCALWKSKRRKFSEYSRADVQLNEMVRDSLRCLTRRFNTKKRGGIRSKSGVLPLSAPLALLTTNTVTPTSSSSSHPVSPV